MSKYSAIAVSSMWGAVAFTALIDTNLTVFTAICAAFGMAFMVLIELVRKI